MRSNTSNTPHSHHDGLGTSWNKLAIYFKVEKKTSFEQESWGGLSSQDVVCAHVQRYFILRPSCVWSVQISYSCLHQCMELQSPVCLFTRGHGNNQWNQFEKILNILPSILCHSFLFANLYHVTSTVFGLCVCVYICSVHKVVTKVV